VSDSSLAAQGPTSREHRTLERGPRALSVGVVVWLASEMMFFAGLFAAWFLLRATNDAWPPDDVHLDLPRAAAATLVLLASSATVHRAVSAAGRDDRRAAVRWLAVTAGLGTIFLANLVLEYVELDFGLSSHAYGSIFYLLTGFHGLHLLGGILFMGGVAGVIAGPTSRAPAEETVEVCAYYWHFVDVVWIAVFSTVYVLQ
jgi:cytochrome c oxidase subunit 3